MINIQFYMKTSNKCCIMYTAHRKFTHNLNGIKAFKTFTSIMVNMKPQLIYEQLKLLLQGLHE